MTPPFDARKLVALLAADSPQAADELDALAARITAAAKEIRDRHSNPYKSPSGMADRIMMKVVGPDGQVKQSIDTGATP